jgi:hypothetical protein
MKKKERLHNSVFSGIVAFAPAAEGRILKSIVNKIPPRAVMAKTPNVKSIVKLGSIWYKKWKAIFKSTRISTCALTKRVLL